MSDATDKINTLDDLLSIRDNPLLKDMEHSELIALVTKLRQTAASPPTISAKLSETSEGIKPRNTVAAKKKAVLDNL